MLHQITLVALDFILPIGLIWIFVDTFINPDGAFQRNVQVKRVGGITFIRVGTWHASVSRKGKIRR